MSNKRTSSQQSTTTSQSKKSKSADIGSTYLHVSLKESGLILKHPPEKCIAENEIIHVIRSIKKNLEKHFDYPRNLSDLFSNLEKECNDLEVFKHYLFPNIVRMSEDGSEEFPVSDSVFKILLSVPALQNKLTDYIFEKAIDLAAESKCGPWIQMILKCFSSLDSIVNTDKISTHLVNLLDVASEKMVKLEIITSIPDIIGDQEHDNIAAEMSRILSEDHDMIPAILDCLSYLCLSDDQYELLQKKTLNLLMSLSKCSYFSNFVKFLLIPGRMSENSYLEAIQGLRNALGWPTTAAQAQEVATSQVLTATAIRNSMVSSKVISNSWLKTISLCKASTDHKPIDVIILLITYSTSEEKQRLVENLIRKQIKLDILKEELLDEAFKMFKPILKEHLRHLIDLSNSLLKTKGDPIVVSFASHMYSLMFAELEDCCQTIVAELLQLGLDSKQCVMSILLVFNKVAAKDRSLLKPQSVQMLTLLDRMDDMPLVEVRAVMNLLCGLAYSYENSVIRDDIHMIIRKELGSSNPRIKVQGILAGIHAVKYLMVTNTEDDDETREVPDDVSYASVTHLSEGDLREAAQIIELISRSTKQFPDMIAFFYDELSTVISSASYINKSFLSWLTDAVTNDLQQNFISDSMEVDTIGDLKLCMEYCLNADSEMDEVIAINIAGLTLSESEVYVGILSPLFQLVQILHYKQRKGNLSSIDALLGCPVIMPKFNVDLIEDMDLTAITNILDCLIHCINWFRELLNAFASQDDEDLKTKILKRLLQVEELEKVVTEILIKSKISYKPPVCTFNVNKYTGETVERKPIKAQSVKQKVTKKPGQNDSVLPETTRTQTTQNYMTVKCSLEISHNMPLRQLSLNLLHLLKMDMTEDKVSKTELTVNTVTFILKCINSNLSNVLISKIKRVTFLSKQDNVVYDATRAEEYAKSVNEVLPQLVEHLKFVTLCIDKHITENSQEEESEVLYSPELLSYLSCLEHLYNLCSIYFKWIGFRNQQYSGLLKSSLRTISNPSTATVSLKDLLVATAQYLHKHEKYCLLLSTAMSLVEFVKSIRNFSDNRVILNILKSLARKFLSQQWKTPEGTLEKGLFFNQSVDQLATIYFINNEVLALKNLTLLLTEDIKLLTTNKNTLSTLKCINRSNFPILYRNLGTALHEATKTRLDKGLTNSEHLDLWKDVAGIMKSMSDIAKTLETRHTLSAFFKKSMPILKLFLSQGIPILEIQFKSETVEVLEVLKILQQSTRFLQTLCCHSRLKKDTALMSKVPHMRQLLETLIYKVKAALAANNCSEAFWMGNLKNKDIHGEVIASQQSIESEESVEDRDEQLPDDDSDETDDEMLDPDSRSVSDIV